MTPMTPMTYAAFFLVGSVSRGRGEACRLMSTHEAVAAGKDLVPACLPFGWILTLLLGNGKHVLDERLAISRTGTGIGTGMHVSFCCFLGCEHAPCQ